MSQPVFDKSAFSRIVNLIAVRVQSKDCHLVTQTLGKNVIFYHPAIKSIVIPDDHSQRLVLLHQDIKLGSLIFLALISRMIEFSIRYSFVQNRFRRINCLKMLP
jgi:hypothetical protein